MIKYITKLLVASLLLSLCISCDDDKSDFEFHAPIPLGDPFILLHDGTYYAYGTSSPDGIVVFTSDDLKLWKQQTELALHKDNSWGNQWFWAPEVYYIESEKKFYMYYSVEERIAVATSDSPLGPFVQEAKAPLLSEGSIDASLFIDDDGQAYLFYNKFNWGNVIWVAKLNDDLQTLDLNTQTECIRVSQEWEREAGLVNEGAFVIKHNGLYYLTYSANDYRSHNYGIGYATATSPMGPWTKYEGNPILQQPSDLKGVGHSAMFSDKQDNLRIVFHAHFDATQVLPRFMHIANVSFTNDNPAIMTISEKYETPRLTYK
ncbi:1,4-beta-xylanase [Dysgonomonas sp. 511]|nr:1,4-beta-xylanase [Dysgonomonas sp. 511]